MFFRQPFDLVSLRQGIVLVLSFLLSACGGYANTRVSGQTDTGAVSVSMQAIQSLTDMETGSFGDIASQGGCDFTDSRHVAAVAEIVDELLFYLPEMGNFEPPVNSVLLRKRPPREDGTIAVYLCRGLTSNAFTLFRSIYLSESFLDDLRKTSVEWGDERLYFSALAYVVYHEVGHAVLNHSATRIPGTDGNPGGSGGFDLPQELEADSFAYDLIRITGRDPLGVVMAQSLEGP